MKDIFPKAELIALMKTQKFKSGDSQLITDFYTSKSENPFDRWDVGSIMFDNGILLEIDKVDGRFVIKFGKNSGWVGGLSMTDIEYSFDLTVLNLEEFTKAFKQMDAKRMYCLCTMYGTGTIDKIVLRGTMSELDAYANVHGYKVIENEYMKYYTRGGSQLGIYVLSSQIYDNIMRRL